MTDFVGNVAVTTKIGTGTLSTLTAVPVPSVEVSLAVNATNVKTSNQDYDAAYVAPFYAANAKGSISGKVTEGGAPVSGAVVRLHNRAVKTYTREAVSDVNGDYTFNDVPGGTAGYYYVVALDPDGGTMYNAVILDRVGV